MEPLLLFHCFTILAFPLRDITDLKIISFTRLYTFEKKRGLNLETNYFCIKATSIQIYDKKNHFIFDPVQKRETNWNFTGCLSDATFYDSVNTIYQFMKPFLDKKCLYLGNMERLLPFHSFTIPAFP